MPVDAPGVDPDAVMKAFIDKMQAQDFELFTKRRLTFVEATIDGNGAVTANVREFKGALAPRAAVTPL